MPEIYQPDEDSLFLSEFIPKEVQRIKPDKILDMGAGSGIQAQISLEAGFDKDLTLADINSEAIKHLKIKFPDARTVKSNLFHNLEDKYDLIIFNPPYLPEHRFDKKPDTSGGEKGSEVINRFLKDAKNNLAENGENTDID